MYVCLQQEQQQQAEERRQTMLNQVLQPSARERCKSSDVKTGTNCLLLHADVSLQHYVFIRKSVLGPGYLQATYASSICKSDLYPVSSTFLQQA